jgi:cap1 methyltransferase
MMSKMGYKSGTGLGKAGQGIVEPVTASTQRGRRGLGLIIEGLEDEKVEWDESREHVVVEEDVHWMKACSEPCPDIRGVFFVANQAQISHKLKQRVRQMWFLLPIISGSEHHFQEKK